MSGVVSPVGPEEPRVYWVRRAVVAAVLLALVIVVVAAINAIAGGGNDSTEAPPPAVSTGPSLRPAESATPTPGPSSAPTPGTSGTPATPATPGASEASESAKPEEKTSESAKTEDSDATPAAPSSTKPAKPGPCSADDLEVKLDGPNSVKVGKTVTFKVIVTNTSDSTCKVTVTPDNFELRIFSGPDRIWTTNDCAKWVKTRGEELAKGKTLAWEQKWDVTRSKGCAKHPSDPRPGTYAANAELDGVPPSQVVMRLS